MLVTLKRAFRGNRNQEQERITSGSRVSAILHQLKADHELLGITVPGCNARANSAILGIKEERGLFYLDELSNEEAHEALLKHGKLQIDGHLKGMEVQFVAHMLRANKDRNGIALYEMAAPKIIAQKQRRKNFRLRLNPGIMVPLGISSLEGEAVKGEAFDLSTTGVGAFLHTSKVPNPGQIIPNVTLSLPQTRALKTKFEIRFARQDGAHHMLRIGARFLELEPCQERLIAQFLAEQQRKRRRYEPR
jgi:c-di-GMP-binding flagellar brake protein YcgR